jgi:hypothetical protein
MTTPQQSPPQHSPSPVQGSPRPLHIWPDEPDDEPDEPDEPDEGAQRVLSQLASSQPEIAAISVGALVGL